MPVPVKYMDKGWLIKANQYAKKKKWNKTIAEEILWRLPENKIIPISFMVPEDDTKITVTVSIAGKIVEGKTPDVKNHEIHIPWQLWEKLPEVESPDETTDECVDNPEEGMGYGAKKFLGLD